MLQLKLQYFGPSDVKSWLMGKDPGFWERLKAGGERDDRGWDGWMASPTQWTWVCTISGRWWRTGKPGMLQPMGLQRVGHHWQTEQQHNQSLKELSNRSLMFFCWKLILIWTVSFGTFLVQTFKFSVLHITLSRSSKLWILLNTYKSLK